MLEALIQDDSDVNIQHILRRMRNVTSQATVSTRREDGTITRATYAEVAARADRLAAGLQGLGIREGDRVGTFAWNSQEHLEAYFGVSCMGAVLHTLNIRLFAEQITYIVNHAEDRVIIVDDSLVKLLEPLAPTFKTVEHFVVVGSGDSGSLPNVIRYEELLAAAPAQFHYPRIDGSAAASLCYTSGTTGNPRGVLYGHRSTVLHAVSEGLAGTWALTNRDRVLVVVPQFHANAWGLPYSCAMVGAALVMPGRFLQPEPLLDLIESEQVTYATAVPTIWQDVLREGRRRPQSLTSLRGVVCGGAAVPRALMEGFEGAFGVPLTQAYGMTETSPLVAFAEPPPGAEGEAYMKYKLKAGRLGPLVDARIVDDDETVLPWDGETTGELQLRGPWIASGYYKDPEATAEKIADGWLRTGDIATIDDLGYIQITDRAKDVIKSGGEWISSIDLENALMSHPDVVEAAVIAKPDERWSERPLACVVLEEGASVSPEALQVHLAPLVAKWWIPDEFALIAELPRTSVGKFDKKVLRARLEDGTLRGEVLSPSPAG